jgi:O-antigen ligase
MTAAVSRPPEPFGAFLQRNERTLVTAALLGAVPIGVSIAIVGLLPVVILIGLAAGALFVRRPQISVLAAIPIIQLVNHAVQVIPLEVAGTAMPFLAWLVLRRTGVLGRSTALKRIPVAFICWLIASYTLFSIPGYHNPDRFTSLVSVINGMVLMFSAGSLRPRPLHVVMMTAVSASLAGVFTYFYKGYDQEGRIISLGLNTNYLGVMMAVGVVAVAVCISETKQWYWLVLAPPLVWVIVATHSRGTLLSLIAGLALFFAYAGARARYMAVLVLAFGLSLLPVFSSFTEKTLLGNRTNFGRSNELRGEVLKAAFRTTIDHPIIGIGYGLFQPTSFDNPKVGRILNTHNDYARLASETGIPGLVMFGAMVFPPFFRRRTKTVTLLTPMVLVYLVGLTDANLIDSMIVSSPIWIMLGLLWTIGREDDPVPPRLPSATAMEPSP